MVKINGYVWVVLEILGMVMLTAGAFGIMDIIGLDMQASIGSMVLGIMLIIISSAFIQIEGHELRKEDKEFRRFDAVRNEARLVPNDLKEGYLIDYTAEPCNAVSYRSSWPDETRAERDAAASDDDVLIVYSG